MNYFEIWFDDETYPNKWFLGEPRTQDGEELDAREFRYGSHYHGKLPWSIPIDQDGIRVAFNLGAFNIPIVSPKVAEAIRQLAPDDIELFPVRVESVDPDYLIMNVTRVEDCVDEQRSEVMKWIPADGRPDKVGKYRMISNTTIDTSRTRGAHIFRIQGWVIDLIVSEAVRAALEPIPNLGIVFRPVT